MGKFDNIIIVSDIDGTFLGKNSRMVPENLEAIEYFKREGGAFTIATGREIMNIPSVIPCIGELCNIPVIACNGACIWDAASGEIVHEVFLPEPEISRITDAARRAHPEIGMRISVRGAFWTERIGDMTRKTFYNMLEHFRVMPYESMPHGRWYKAAWDGTPEELGRLRTVLEAELGEECLVQLGHSTIMEIQSCKGTKGSMLSVLKRLTGREDAVLWAIGDYENDYGMLQMADRRAMPVNGMDLLRTLPDMIEVCNHDEGAIAGLIGYIEEELRR